MDTGKLLHSVITLASRETIGVDVDYDGVEKMKSMVLI